MTRDEVKTVLLQVSKEKYQLDLDTFAEDTPLAELKDLNPKMDSMAVIELIFDVEDALGIKSSDMSQPANLAEIIDQLVQVVNTKK